MIGAYVTQRMADVEVQCLQGVNCSTGLPRIQANESNLTIILQLAFGIIGAVAAIMIIVAALNMAAAQGDPQKVAKARQTIMFAAVGLVIAVSAEAIVTFTIGRL